jgi:uncharacterized protein
MSGAVAGLVGFTRALHDAGLAVGPDQALVYCRAGALLDLSTAEDLYWAGRACLVTRHEDLPVYDLVFDRYFGGRRPSMALTVSGSLPPAPALTDGQPVARRGAWSEDQDDGATAGARASHTELLRHKHFGDCTPEELAVLRVLMGRLRLDPPRRRTRRTRPDRRGADRDIRRTIRRSLRTHGELLHPAWRAPREQARRVIWLLDVSGSMTAYSRALLQLAHSASSSPGTPTEVFCFGTRLTRITRQLRQRNPDRALAQAAEAVMDWEGGTRIGESIGAFTRGWGRPGMARGAVVVICSDGLERGEPALLGTEMARLARLDHRIVWVNPLKGDPRYEPLARGMRAALPFVDVFVSGHDLASLEGLAALLPELAERSARKTR